MREFFHGWRRKAGVVTLGLACVFTVAWVRSLAVTDVLMSDQIVMGINCLASVDSSLVVVIWTNTDLIAAPSRGLPHWITEEPASLDSEHIRFEWRWRWIGFRHGVLPDDGGESIWVVPNWALVLPLTLLSAYLLLGKPRPANTMKTSGPAQTEAP